MSGLTKNSAILLTILSIFILLACVSLSQSVIQGGGMPKEKEKSKTGPGIVSGRILCGNLMQGPVYDAAVSINGKPAEIYGTTYLALDVAPGKVTVEARNSKGEKVRENLQVEPGVVSSVNLIFPDKEEGTPPKATKTDKHLLFQWPNGLSVQLNLEGKELLGIGEVKVDTVALRKPLTTELPTIEKMEKGSPQQNPWDHPSSKFVELKSEKCQFIDYETKGEAVIVHSRLVTSEGNMDLDWILTPWQTEVEGNKYKGLGYSFSVSSPVDISKLEFRCSWELNASVAAKKLLTRRTFDYWQRDCTHSEGFNVNREFLLGMSQPPTYQYDASGALATFIWPPDDVANILRKDANSDQLFFYDKFFLGKTKRYQTPFRVVLYSNKGGLNEYTYIFDQVNKDYRHFYGQEEIVSVPGVITTDYLYKRLASRQLDENAKASVLTYSEFADNILPKLAELAFKHATVNFCWMNDERKDVGIKRFDATWSLDIPDDEIDGLKYFIHKANQLDIQIMLWVTSLYSSRSPLLIENPDWYIKDGDGKAVTFLEDIRFINYRSGYLVYALKRLKKLKEDLNFDNIGHDCYLSGFPTDSFSAHIKSSMDPRLQFISATQRMGYLPYIESISPFGMPYCGTEWFTPRGLPPDPEMMAKVPPNTSKEEIAFVARRNLKINFKGREYLAYKTSMVMYSSEHYYPLQIDYYKFLANKSTPMVSHKMLSIEERKMIGQVNNDYLAALPFMHKRYILSDEKGILWNDRDGKVQILFAYQGLSYDLDKDVKEVFDITSRKDIKIEGRKFKTEEKHTYKIIKIITAKA